jgi:hypothetical protein
MKLGQNLQAGSSALRQASSPASAYDIIVAAARLDTLVALSASEAGLAALMITPTLTPPGTESKEASERADRVWAKAMADPAFVAAFEKGKMELAEGKVVEVLPEDL